MLVLIHCVIRIANLILSILKKTSLDTVCPPSYVLCFKTGRLFHVVLASLMLAACTAHGQESQTGRAAIPANINADYYLQQMRQSSNDTKTDYQLLAIRALLKEGRLPQAQQQLAALPPQLDAARQRERLLLSAKFELASHQPQSAAAALQQIDSASLDAPQRLRYTQAMIDAGQSRPSLDLALDLVRAYIAQASLLTEPAARQQNIDKTWQTLVSLPSPQSNLVINADENTLQGWLVLLRVYQDNRQEDPHAVASGHQRLADPLSEKPGGENTAYTAQSGAKLFLVLGRGHFFAAAA
ncbi:hypothetical protein D8L93_03730 [Sodalis-like symbiont of Bactericera trigonica]|nr:hypothetical protein D8L93_03730 [Sodalis-like symbiont of Bactericera trigonica]